MPEKTDISQSIKKYLDGKLDAHAMYELERRAQDDPFLMDALEGYQNTAADIDTGLASLAARLQQRTEKKEARIILWRTLSIAASILLLLGLGIFWYDQRKPLPEIQKEIVSTSVTPEPEAAKPVAPAVVHTDTTSAKKYKNVTRLIAGNTRHKHAIEPVTAVTEKETLAAAPLKEKDGYSDSQADKVQDSTPLNETIVMEYAAKKKTGGLTQYKSTDTGSFQPFKKDYLAKVKADSVALKEVRIKGTDIAKLDERQKGPNANAFMPGLPQNTLEYQSRTAQANDIAPVRPGMSAVMGSPVRGYFAKRTATGGIAPLNPVILHGKMVKGMVKVSGEPVEYATVKIKGTTISTLTDSKGRFTLYAVPDSAIIQILADGAVLQETKVTHRDMQLIAIHSDDVINAVNALNDNGANDNTHPRPSNGWSDMNAYLKQNAISPDGKPGVVRLSFTVNADNSLTDFKIIQSLGSQTDNAAIKLIKDGPAWYSSSDNNAGTITISIKFHARGK